MKCMTKYVAFDVHQATTVASVRGENGRVLARYARRGSRCPRGWDSVAVVVRDGVAACGSGGGVRSAPSDAPGQ
jgi:hypothetical protein